MTRPMSLTEQTLGALAFAGDLSMGQPPEHSLVVSILAHRVAALSGAPEAVRQEAGQLALIRWAGCTGNARDFADLLGDDIRGRAELLAGRNPFVSADPPSGSLHDAMEPLALAHCEIASLLARRLGLPPGVSGATDDIFETWDGNGLPVGKAGEDIFESAQHVALAGDAEVFTRIYGVTRAAYLIEARASAKYEPGLARAVARKLSGWLVEIGQRSLTADAFDGAGTAALSSIGREAALALLGDFVDLKVPGHAGRSRAVSELAEAVARHARLPAEAGQRVVAAVAVASIGQVAIPNRAFTDPEHASESVRLAPYWTGRILSRMPMLVEEAALAVLAYDRIDGSGIGQGTTTAVPGREARLVQALRAAVEAPGAFVSGTWSPIAVEAALRPEADAGALDGAAVECVLAGLGVRRAAPRDPGADLTQREAEVLRALAAGLANKQIARALDMSPKTVSTHLERVFRKLGVRSRAAATLKALEAGLA